MTDAFKQLLYIYGDAICGRKTVLSENCDREEIAKKAIEQNILPIVYFNIFGEETNNKYYPLIMQSLANNERRMFFLGKLSKELNEAGIEHCVLKGCSLANLYPMPELRISGDVDILINPSDEKMVMQFLEERNFVVKERDKNAQNFTAKHPKAGLFEIHVKLFDSEFDKYVLKGRFKVKEPFEKMVNSDGTELNILGKNDGLYFAASHMIKHFVKDGLGLRQISDWLLYVEKYRDEIDMDSFNSVIKELDFEKFMNAIYTVGNKYFKMNFNCEEENPDDILSDMDEGGSFGHNDTERAKYKAKLLHGIYGKSENERRKSALRTLWKIAFPSKRTLVQKGFLKESSSILMIPIGWLRRWTDVLLGGKLKKIDSVTGKVDVNEEKFEKRHKMLNDYNFYKNKRKENENDV